MEMGEFFKFSIISTIILGPTYFPCMLHVTLFQISHKHRWLFHKLPYLTLYLGALIPTLVYRILIKYKAIEFFLESLKGYYKVLNTYNF